MPPMDADPLTRVERTKAIFWLQGRLENSGLISDWERERLFPAYGSYVDHESLFDGSVTRDAANLCLVRPQADRSSWLFSKCQY